jgi:DNA-binding transcriptional ArsR family regulator
MDFRWFCEIKPPRIPGRGSKDMQGGTKNSSRSLLSTQGSHSGEADLHKIGSTEKLVLNYLDSKALGFRRSKIKKYSTSKEIAPFIKKSQRTVSNTLRRLEARGLVVTYQTGRKYLRLFGPNWSRTAVWEELRKERNTKKTVMVTYRLTDSGIIEDWEN